MTTPTNVIPAQAGIHVGHQTIVRMRALRHALALYGLGALALASPLGAQATPDRPSPVALQRAVQRFYDWYVPLTRGSHQGPTWRVAQRYRRTVLDAPLAQALRDDAEAQAAAQEIVGLDGDPFLDAQDPCERYEVGPATHSDERVRLEVRAVCAGVRQERPNVIAEVVERPGGWAFTNLRYPDDGSDLLTLLGQFRRERESQQSTSPARVTVRQLARLRWIVGDWRGTGTAGTTQEPFFERYRFADDSTLVVESFADSTWRMATDTTRYELRGGRLGNPGAGSQWVAARLDSLGVDFVPVARARNTFRWARAPRSGPRPPTWIATITPLGSAARPPRHYLMERVRSVRAGR